MITTIIDNIPLDIRPDQIYPRLRIKPRSSLEKRFNDLLKSSAEIARPKVTYKLVAVEHGDASIVLLDDVSFRSKILQVNLQTCQRAFPFIATCGIELDAWAKAIDNPLETFWAETINMLALGAAIEAFKNHIRKLYKSGQTSTMNPGALADWPLIEQYKLFEVMGDASRAIGVKLSRNAMMIPLKSVSGIEFEAGEKFCNCQLCPRDKCPDRRVHYDETLLATKYK